VTAFVLALLVHPACETKATSTTRSQGIPNYGHAAGRAPAAPEHPRLFVRAADLPRLRSWATESNPMWRDGLRVVAESAKRDMDQGKIPDKGDCVHQHRYCESYAELFGFLSLVAPDEAERGDYARRAKVVLMSMIDRAYQGAPNDPFANPRFSVYNRSRWVGEAFGLTVDWIYPTLTAAEKARIRTVFLRWAEENMRATVTAHNHPRPIGVLNDPALLANRTAVRFASNNYFVSHMRNIGLMALAFDQADDPLEPSVKRTYPRLRDYLKSATGAWLYMQDHLFRTDARGGAAPEGNMYGPETLAFVMQFHLALQTAGEAALAKHGRQAVLDQNPFWREAPIAYAHTLSPDTITREKWEGPVFEPAWFGDAQEYSPRDWIGFFGPLGVYGMNQSDAARVNAARFIQTHLSPGGAQGVRRRATAYNGGHAYLQAIWYFLLFDPAAPQPTDFRAALPPEHFGEGLGQIFARTSWNADATWFSYQLAWQSVDHRHGDGNTFGLYRRGEWLTKERAGYGPHFENSDQHNTLAIENDRPNHAGDDRVASYWKRGSQYNYLHGEDGKLLARSFGKGFVYALGDATGFYNSTHEDVRDVTHASRSIVWIKPDHVVIYDRASTGKEGRFKRFFLHTPGAGAVTGDLVRVVTQKGQQLFVKALLPRGAVIRAELHAARSQEEKPAQGDPMTAVVRVEPAKVERDVRFLHVLQGADAGAQPDRMALVTSSSGAPFAGAVVKNVAVLFPEKLGAPPGELGFRVPAGVTRVLVTGLAPHGAYDVERRPDGAVTVKKGSRLRADGGGVLDL
jgi:hypothetical protein